MQMKPTFNDSNKEDGFEAKYNPETMNNDLFIRIEQSPRH